MAGQRCRQSPRNLLVLALVLVPGTSALADDPPLGLADYAAYRVALDPKPAEQEATAVTFRDLWDRPGAFQGNRVAVGGRVERVFHQGPVGTFPPLAEAWIVGSTGDPLCLAFPDSAQTHTPKPGDVVRFEGTFLRRIRYRGGDADRLAPLIVGPTAPGIDHHAPTPPAAPAAVGSPFDGPIVLVLGAIVLLGLARDHLRRPKTARPIVDDPPPPFLDRPEPGPTRPG